VRNASRTLKLRLRIIAHVMETNLSASSRPDPPALRQQHASKS
jgi:hypothetical protein